MLLKLSLGLGLATPIHMDGPSHLQTTLPTAHLDTAAKKQTQDRELTANTQAFLDAWPECHGHSGQADKQATDNILADADTNTPCASQADCHHCCAVGLSLWMGLGLQPDPSALPVPEPQGWKNASLRPVLRPPIA